jgi:pantoate--beta-alanine ligase
MIIIKKTAHLAALLSGIRSSQNTIGFVPTMGALHAGHLSLLAASKKSNSFTLASIFVNPAQFNDKKDFEKYPVTIEKDIELLVAAGCDALFLPSVQEIYPQGWEQPQPYALGYLETLLEGQYRPGHFQGVCRVMHRLLDLVQPHHLYMGQKDYQQCMVVSRLLSILHSNAQLHTCPTLREPDGLAMSSRNTRLDKDGRNNAVAIYNTLIFIKNNIQPGETAPLIKSSVAMLAQNNFRIDYVAIADAATLEPVAYWNGEQRIVALIAAFQNEVRLIDNMLLR